MASHTMHLFSIGQEALRKISAHLHRDYAEGGDWFSPELSYSGKTGPVNKVDSRVENRPRRKRVHEKEETDVAV